METREGETWVEVARGEGGPGVTADAVDVTIGSGLRARIFVSGNGVADQDHTLDVTAQRTA